jgi:hypothetical protein
MDQNGKSSMALAGLPDRCSSTQLLYRRKQNIRKTIASVDMAQANRVLLCAASKVLDA